MVSRCGLPAFDARDAYHKQGEDLSSSDGGGNGYLCSLSLLFGSVISLMRDSRYLLMTRRRIKLYETYPNIIFKMNYLTTTSYWIIVL